MKKLGKETKVSTQALERYELKQRSAAAEAARWAMVSYGALRAIHGATKAAGDYQYQMVDLKNVLGTTTSQTKELGNVFKDLSGKVEYGSTALAKGATDLARSGMSMKEIATAVPVMADVMTAGQIDANSAVSLMVQTMRAFNIEADQVRSTMDKLTYLSIATPASLKFLSEGMKYTTRASGLLKLSLEDTMSTVGLLSPFMMKAGATSRAFSQFMMRVVKPSGAAVEAMKKHGIAVKTTFKDAGGIEQTRHPLEILNDVITQANEKISGKEARDKFLATYLGMRAAAVAGLEFGAAVRDSSGKLHRGMIPALRVLQKGLANADGLLKEHSGNLRSTYNVSVERLNAQWLGFKRTLGEKLLPVMSKLLEVMSGFLEILEKTDKMTGGGASTMMAYGMMGIAGGALINTLRYAGAGLMALRGWHVERMALAGAGTGSPAMRSAGAALMGGSGQKNLASISRGVGSIGMLLKGTLAVGVAYIAAEAIAQWFSQKGIEEQKAARERAGGRAALTSAVMAVYKTGKMTKAQGAALGTGGHSELMAAMLIRAKELESKLPAKGEGRRAMALRMGESFYDEMSMFHSDLLQKVKASRKDVVGWMATILEGDPGGPGRPGEPGRTARGKLDYGTKFTGPHAAAMKAHGMFFELSMLSEQLKPYEQERLRHAIMTEWIDRKRLEIEKKRLYLAWGSTDPVTGVSDQAQKGWKEAKDLGAPDWVAGLAAGGGIAKALFTFVPAVLEGIFTKGVPLARLSEKELESAYRAESAINPEKIARSLVAGGVPDFMGDLTPEQQKNYAKSLKQTADSFLLSTNRWEKLLAKPPEAKFQVQLVTPDGVLTGEATGQSHSNTTVQLTAKGTN